MLVRHVDETVPNTDVPGVALRTLIGEEQGEPRFAMRVFEVAPGGSTPYHQHWWEHEVFILAGSGTLRGEGGNLPLEADQAVFVPGMEWHAFMNTGSETLRFLCMIPTGTGASGAFPAGAETPVCDPVAVGP